MTKRPRDGIDVSTDHIRTDVEWKGMLQKPFKLQKRAYDAIRGVLACSIAQRANGQNGHTAAAILNTDFGSGKTFVALHTALETIRTQNSHVAIVLKTPLLLPWRLEIKKHVRTPAKFFVYGLPLHPAPRKIYVVTQNQALEPRFLAINWKLVIFDEIQMFLPTTKYFQTIFTQLQAEKILFMSATLPPHTVKHALGLHSLFPRFERRAKMKQLVDEITVSGCSERKTLQVHEFLVSPTKDMLHCRKIMDEYEYDAKTVKDVWRYLVCMESLSGKELGLMEEKLSTIMHKKRNQSFGNAKDHCPICMSKKIDPRQLIGGHVMCSSCITEWNRMQLTIRSKVFKCPLCNSKTRIDQKGPKTFVPRYHRYEEDLPNPKITYVKKWLSQIFPTKEQLLVYTQFACIATEVSTFLADKFNINVYQCSFGKCTSKDQDAIRKFASADIQVLIMDICEYAAGYSFPNVSHIAVIDFDSPIHFQQAQHRVGACRLDSETQTSVALFVNENGIEQFMAKMGEKDVKTPSRLTMAQLNYAMLKRELGTQMNAVYSKANKQDENIEWGEQSLRIGRWSMKF